jgi:hypothetical protein
VALKDSLARLIPLRPWIALALLLTGVAITITAFRQHNLWLALLGGAPLAGALGFLLIPLPHSR